MIFADRPPAALADYTGFLMNWIALRSRRHFGEKLEERFGLHPQQFGALSVVARQPGLTQLALSEAAGAHPSAMVSTLDALEERGLVERRVDPEDRRRRTIHLTPAGERLLRGAQQVAAETGAEVLSALTKAERAELNRLLRKVAGVG